MKQDKHLNNIIREVKRGDLEEIRKNRGWNDDKIIRFDIKKGEILTKNPSFGFRRHVRYYQVYPDKVVEGSIEDEIKDFASSRVIEIKIKYQVKCKQGNEDKAVLALHKQEDPEAFFNRWLKKQLRDFVASKRKKNLNPVLDYFQYREELKDHLIETASKDMGLEAEFVLSLKDEKQLKTYNITSGFFPVRVKDCDEELNLKFETDLEVSEENKIYAVLQYPKLNNLEGFIKEKIKKYVLKSAILHQFAYELNRSFKDQLTVELGKLLAKKGREIAWLRLESDIPWEVPEQSSNIHHIVQCDIKDYSKKIEVEHKLLMQLENLGKYIAKQSDKSLREWVKEKLNEITRNVLFERRYVKILLDFEKEEEDDQEILKKIRDEMQRLAGDIGCAVKHLIVEPDMTPLKFRRDGFTLKRAGDFSTLNKRVNISLDIVVTGKIKDLSKIPQYITPEKNIIEEMEQVIYSEVEKQMHSVDPREFYMPAKFKNEKSIESILKTGIENRLQEEFCAENVNVVIKKLENDLLKRVIALINGNPYYFEVDIFPLREAGTGEVVTFEVEFVIKSVVNWDVFIYKDFESTTAEIARIKETLKKDLSLRFSTIPFKRLRYFRAENSVELLEVARKAQGKIAGLFGLEVIITFVKRLPIESEIKRQKVLTENIESQALSEAEARKIEREAALEDLKKLTTGRTKYLDGRYSDKEPDEFTQEEIEKAKNKLLKSGIPEEVSGVPVLESPGALDPDEYPDEFKSELPEGESPPPVEGPKEQKDEDKKTGTS